MASTVLPTFPSGPPAPTPLLARLHRASAMLAPALVYLTIRQVSLLVLVWMSAATGVDTRSVLTSWDGAWFLGLATGATRGYRPGSSMRSGRAARRPRWRSSPATQRWSPQCPGCPASG